MVGSIGRAALHDLLLTPKGRCRLFLKGAAVGDCERNGTLPATRSPRPTSDESASGNCALELGEADCGGAGDRRPESYSMPQQRDGRYLLDNVYRDVFDRDVFDHALVDENHDRQVFPGKNLQQGCGLRRWNPRG